MNDDYARFLADANFISGGKGARSRGTSSCSRVNAHFALPGGVVLEPVVQYLVNGNSYFNPFTARRPKDGFYGGFTLSVPSAPSSASRRAEAEPSSPFEHLASKHVGMDSNGRGSSRMAKFERRWQTPRSNGRP